MPEYVEGQPIVGFVRPGSNNISNAQIKDLNAYLQRPDVHIIPKKDTSGILQGSIFGLDKKVVLIVGLGLVALFVLKHKKKKKK